jgi:hypothetical protein
MSGKEWSSKEINFVLKQYKKGYSRFEITKQFNEKFKDNRSPNSIKHCIETHGADIEKNLPRVLVLDLETKPIVSYTWGTYDQNVALNQIISDTAIISWSAKWLGEDKVFYKDQRGKKGSQLDNDKELLKPLWKLMDESSIILGQNSNKFDIKRLNAKFLEHGFGAPSDYKKIDTLVLAKKHYAFTSNKLEWMSKKFCKQTKKSSHNKFPGFSLWDECMKGNLEAWKELELYNKQDVLATEELFLKLAEFDKSETVTSALRTYNKNKKKK